MNRSIFDLIIVSHLLLFYSSYICYSNSFRLINIFGIYSFIVNIVSFFYHFYFEKYYLLGNFLARLLFLFALVINTSYIGFLLAILICLIYYLSNINKENYEKFHFWQHIFASLWLYIIGIS